MIHNRNGMTRFTAEVKAHLRELRHVLSELSSYSTPEPGKDLLFIRACGSLLHDFYTGVESIFLIIADEIDESRPSGSDWHRRLIVGMAAELPGIRPAVISEPLKDMLDPYRGFRHIFRNVYGSRLEWGRIHELIDDLPKVVTQLEAEVTDFLKTMASLSE